MLSTLPLSSPVPCPSRIRKGLGADNRRLEAGSCLRARPSSPINVNEKERRRNEMKVSSFHFVCFVFHFFFFPGERTRKELSSLSTMASSPPQADPRIPAELLPALEALYGGASSSQPTSSPDSRRAAERWLVAFQSSDAAWQVRELEWRFSLVVWHRSPRLVVMRVRLCDVGERES